MFVIQNAAMLMAPIPGKDFVVHQELAQLVVHISFLRIKPGNRLMMGKQNHLPLLFVVCQIRKPGNLIDRQTGFVVPQVRIGVGAIESNQQPIIVLESEITCLLPELVQRLLKIRFSSRIHLVI